MATNFSMNQWKYSVTIHIRSCVNLNLYWLLACKQSSIKHYKVRIIQKHNKKSICPKAYNGKREWIKLVKEHTIPAVNFYLLGNCKIRKYFSNLISFEKTKTKIFNRLETCIQRTISEFWQDNQQW